MRKYLKNRCLGTIDLLGEAHAKIIRLAERKQPEVVAELLELCQQCAVLIGNTIDGAEGEGTEEVHQLEEYCEMAYRLHEEVLTKKNVNARKAVKNLNRLVKMVSDGIRNHLPATKEVVFLPYKASMWDSLESVWREMDADSDVSAVVIPVPYYDKNPDGSFRQMHYELDQFPSNVPVTGYRDYDLADRHPDAIYIHNPYDEANYVTSVHPDFYSSKLKEYTDELVYIPYFILGDIDPANAEAVENAAHFITVPGVINAHRVIVQSEGWRQAYIDVMTKYAGRDTRQHWEAKIEARVSPKVQRVSDLRESDYELPEEWEQVVRNAAGKRKKIIFYNTSVSAFLQDSERMVDKIRRVLEIFKHRKDEVALLWRPHPLMEATLVSMRPRLWEEYKHLVEEYRADGWGIYDDSAELDRAIAVSDAYYGDMSSVVWLYKETGKPVMIQNVFV